MSTHDDVVAPSGEQDTPKRRAARHIVRAILRDLADRRGLRHEWEGIDSDVKLEIIRTWRELVYRELVKDGL